MIPQSIYRAYEVAHQVQQTATLRPSWRMGPNPLWYQTKEGIVLLQNTDGVIELHTLLGEWTLTNQRVDITKIFKTLNLEPMESLAIGERWRVKKVNDFEIEPPIYRKRQDFITYEKAKQIWEEFSYQMPDLAKERWELAQILCSQLNNKKYKKALIRAVCHEILKPFSDEIIHKAYIEIITNGRIDQEILQQYKEKIGYLIQFINK